MNSNTWMHENTVHIARAGGVLRDQSNFGIVTGLEVQRVGTTLSLRVLPGTALIAGVECTLDHIEDGLLPASIQDGTEVFVVMQVVPVVTTTLNRYDETTVASQTYKYVFSVVSTHDYFTSQTAIVLAHCRYSFTSRITSIPVNAGVQLPARFFGVFDSLDTVNANTDFLDNLVSQDSIAVRKVATTPGLVGTDVLELYYWSPVQDPVTITVTNPETSVETEVSAIWGPRNVDLGDLTPVLHYWLPSLTEPDGQHLWTSAYRTHTWVLGNAQEHGMTSTVLAEMIGVVIDINTDVRRYAFMRPAFSGLDIWHRNQSHVNTSVQNPHGLGFNDLGYDVMPLHKQIFNAGFGVTSMEQQGIIGVFIEEAIENVNVRTDYFGTTTGVMLNKYLRTKHVPVSIAYLYETTTGNNTAYDLVRDVVDLGKAFVGGDLEHYPEFYYLNSVDVGERVIRHVNSITHLYECITFCPGGHTGPESDNFDPTYFTELFRNDLILGYYYIPDYEYSLSTDNNIYVSANTTSAVVSEGKVIDPVESGVLTFNTASLKDIPVDKLMLSVTAENKLVASDTVIDRANLESKRSGSTVKNLVVPAQLKAYVVNAPDVYDLAPPEGTLVVTSTGFYGTYRLFYTYGVDARTVFTTNSQSETYAGELNLAPAQLVQGSNYIPRDSWEYSESDKQVIIASDVYVPSRTYKLLRHASESVRNRRGIITSTGSYARPEGTKARAILGITEYDRLALGDTITLSIPNSNSVVKTLQEVAGYTGFIKAPTLAETYDAIALAFNTDPVCVAQGVLVSHTISGLVFYAGKAGPEGNAYSLSVQSINTSLIATVFEQGSEHTDVLEDIRGLEFSIRDYQVPDDYGYYAVWAQLESNNTSIYYRVAVVPASTTGITTGVIDANTWPVDSDTYDLSQELQLSVQIAGTDSEDNAIQETLVFDVTSFCCIPNYRVLNPYAYVRSQNFFKSITSWTCLDQANTGSASLVLVAESASGTRDLFDACLVDWTGKSIKSIKDKRRFVDASTNRPVSDVMAEALSNTAAILQLQ